MSKINNSNLDPDMKCAPSKKYSNGSCFSLETLKSIAENYNKKNTNKININQSKEALVNDLENKLSDKCNEQTCWLRLDIVKELNNEDISLCIGVCSDEIEKYFLPLNEAIPTIFDLLFSANPRILTSCSFFLIIIA